MDSDVNDVQGLEELPSLLYKKEELTFILDELVNVNIGTTYDQRLF